jgi:hypothetical protein
MLALVLAINWWEWSIHRGCLDPRPTPRRVVNAPNSSLVIEKGQERL